MKTALILVFSNLKHDARVTRQVSWVKKNYRVTLVCFDAEQEAAHDVIRIKKTKLTPARKSGLGIALLLKQYNIAFRLFHTYQFLYKDLKAKNFDLIVANDVDTLPIAFEIKGSRSKIIFDAHEYAPRHFENNWIWKTFFQPFYVHLCKKFIPKVDGMCTVGEGLAKEYHKEFGVPPVIVSNAAKYYDIQPSELLPNRIRLIHHGIANKSRNLELLFDMMNHLDDRFTLDLILMTSDYASAPTKAYIESLKEKASKTEKIRILPAVKSYEIVEKINAYDIGVFLLPPVNFNYANTLPNKLFDFVQARLGIAIGPSQEMASIVKKYNIGVISKDFNPKTLADELNKMSTSQVASFKKNATHAAKDLNAEKNEVIFNDLLKKLH